MCLSSYLEVTRSLISEFVGCRDCDVFEISNRYRSPVRIKCKRDFAGSVRRVNSSTGFVKVHYVVILFVHQFNNVTLRAAQLRRYLVCNSRK